MLYLNGLPVPTTMFSDNTSQVWKLPEEILTTTNFAHVTWEFSNEGEFLQLAQLKLLLDHYDFRTVLRLPYLPYGRQDKEPSNTATFALYAFAELLNHLGFEEVICMDPHSSVAEELIYNFKAIYPVDKIYEVAKLVEANLFCYPDAGAFEKYINLLKGGHIYGEKVRDQLTGNITSYKLIGTPIGTVLIVDDICDGGMTFKLLAKDLLAAGAKSVVLFVTHGIFSKGTRTLFESGIQRIFTHAGEVSERQGTIQI